jgi:hypothetical protein
VPTREYVRGAADTVAIPDAAMWVMSGLSFGNAAFARFAFEIMPNAILGPTRSGSELNVVNYTGCRLSHFVIFAEHVMREIAILRRFARWSSQGTYPELP